jgi:hypothetical protein
LMKPKPLSARSEVIRPVDMELLLDVIGKVSPFAEVLSKRGIPRKL